MTTQIEVKERPILFSGPMVKAILEGRKTQTRRVIKPQPSMLWCDEPLADDGSFCKAPCGFKSMWEAIGSRLWVRETWLEDRIPELPKNIHGCVHYRANGYTYQEVVDSWDGHWKPSIFMPRWASRITLEITSVRVERLQDISGYDACHEGAPYETIMDDHYDGRDYRKGFQQLWESINGKKYPWSTNPWVWVVEFKRVKP